MARSDERMGMLPLLPVSNSICQWPIGNWQHWNWQHFHIGNIHTRRGQSPLAQMARSDERMEMLPVLPVSSSSGQCPIGNWQHLHIGNILKTPRHSMRQMVGRARRARRKVPQTQHQPRIIADGSESRPYHANLPRWYFHFVLDLSLMRLIAASAADTR